MKAIFRLILSAAAILAVSCAKGQEPVPVPPSPSDDSLYVKISAPEMSDGTVRPWAEGDIVAVFSNAADATLYRLRAISSGSTAVFALFYWVADVKQWRWWTPFFAVVGMNSIAIYMLNHIVDFDAVAKFFLGGAVARLDPALGMCLVGLGHFAACWFVTWFLWRHKVFFKV